MKLTHGIPYFLLGALLAFLLMRGCDQPEPADTVYIRGRDSIRTEYDTIYQTIQVPYPVAVYTVRDRPESGQPDPCDSVRVYRSRVDTLGAVLHITDSVQGVLLRQEIAGTWPRQYITRTDTIRSVLTGRAYRYGLGVLTDGKGLQIVGQYGVSRNVAVMGSWEPNAVRIGLGVRF